MLVGRGFGSQSAKPALEIAARGRRGVLVDAQRGRGVAAEQGQQPRADAAAGDPRGHFAGDLVQARPRGFDVQPRGSLAHRPHMARTMAARQPDLFALSPLLPGLRLAEDFVTPDEEGELKARIDAAGLAPFEYQGWEGRRLTASFGHAYDFSRGRLATALPIPA